MFSSGHHDPLSWLWCIEILDTDQSALKHEVSHNLPWESAHNHHHLPSEISQACFPCLCLDSASVEEGFLSNMSPASAEDLRRKAEENRLVNERFFFWVPTSVCIWAVFDGVTLGLLLFSGKAPWKLTVWLVGSLLLSFPSVGSAAVLAKGNFRYGFYWQSLLALAALAWLTVGSFWVAHANPTQNATIWWWVFGTVILNWSLLGTLIVFIVMMIVVSLVLPQ